MKRAILNGFLICIPFIINAQNTAINTHNWQNNPGIIGTLILVLIVAFVAVIIMSAKITAYAESMRKRKLRERNRAFDEEIINLNDEEIDSILEQRKSALKYRISQKELSGELSAQDEKGLINKATNHPENPLFDEKLNSSIKIKTSDSLRKTVIYYLGAATFWLVFGTFVGEYLGFKFIWPELDSTSWLAFGRLRPVHTNTVFWGWASLAMIGLGHYVIARTSNTEIYSAKLSRTAWILINSSIILGDLMLMSGINNGGGEYREYIWPVFLLFASGLAVTLFNFYKTVAQRKIKEIYISNWYILAALIWTIILVTIGYIPTYQNGLGETVIQGYYMHQGVGMWFMTFTLGLTYYYLPSSLNRPIYS